MEGLNRFFHAMNRATFGVLRWALLALALPIGVAFWCVYRLARLCGAGDAGRIARQQAAADALREACRAQRQGEPMEYVGTGFDIDYRNPPRKFRGYE